jgi:hypothetical protein
MNNVGMFFIGMIAAWLPTLVILAIMLRRDPFSEK